MLELLPYFITYGIVTILLAVPTRDKLLRVICTVFAFVIIFIFSGGRYMVGTDSVTYQQIFERNAEMPWSEIFSPERKEILFAILSKVTYSYGGMFLTQGIFGVLTLLPVYATLKKDYKQIPMHYAMTIFLLLFFTTSFNILRQMLAVSIVFWGFKFIERGHLLRYILTVLIAMGFHSTALIALAILPLWNFRERKVLSNIPLVIFWATAFSVMVFFRGQVISFIEASDDYGSYASPETRGGNRDFILYVIELAYVSAVLYKRRKSEHVLLLYQTMLMVVLIGLTGFFSPYIKRLAFYFSLPGRVLLFPEIEQYFVPTSKKVVHFLGYAWFILIFIVTVYILKQGNLLPYQFKIVWE
ncbi:EpsG family protein [Streptococcus suis]|uniref:EpsG family protein n=1 Tax=Streptococcus suis TaxID=1307 RepID=UPI0038BAFDE7